MSITQKTDPEVTHAREQIALLIELIRSENRAAEQQQRAQQAERTATQARLQAQRDTYRKSGGERA